MKSIENQSANSVNITGTLMDVVLREGKTKKDGKPYRSGTATIRVNQHYGNKDEVSDIQENFIAMKFKNDGQNNSNYTNYGKFADGTYKTAQNVGIENATRLRSSGAHNGRITENMFATAKDPETVISTWRIDTTFFNEANGSVSTPTSNADCATFNVDMVVLEIGREMNTSGEETGRLKIVGGLIQYGPRLDCVTFYVENPSAIDFLERNWQVNDTVNAVGRIRVATQTVSYHSENSWGEEIPQESTRTKRELIITSSNGPDGGMPYDEDMSYDIEDVKRLNAERKIRKEQAKVTARNSGNKTAAATNEAPKSAYGWEM